MPLDSFQSRLKQIIQRHTYRQMHSIPERRLYTRRLTAGGQDSVCSSFFQFQAIPKTWLSLPQMRERWNTHGYNHMRAISILPNDFQSVNSLRVPDDVVKSYWSIFFDPYNQLDLRNVFKEENVPG